MSDRPVAILMDESASYLSSSDHVYLSLSRETKTCTILGFQSIDGLVSEIRDQFQVKSLLSNIGTRCYLSNACPSSNSWASEDAGEEFFLEYSGSGKLENDEFTFSFLRPKNALPPFEGMSGSVGRQKRRVLPPEVFTQLEGGTRQSGRAEAWVRVMTPLGMRLYNVYFNIDLRKRKRSWFSDKATVTLA